MTHFYLESTMLPNNVRIAIEFDEEDLDDAYEMIEKTIDTAIAEHGNATTAAYRIDLNSLNGDTAFKWVAGRINERLTEAHTNGELTAMMKIMAVAIAHDVNENGAAVVDIARREGHSASWIDSTLANGEYYVACDDSESEAYEALGRTVGEDDVPDHLTGYFNWESYGSDHATGCVEINNEHYAVQLFG